MTNLKKIKARIKVASSFWYEGHDYKQGEIVEIYPSQFAQQIMDKVSAEEAKRIEEAKTIAKKAEASSLTTKLEPLEAVATSKAEDEPKFMETPVPTVEESVKEEPKPRRRRRKA